MCPQGRSGSYLMPDSVTSIGFIAFQNCFKLTNLSLGPNVTSIEEGAFESCTGLTSVTVPNSVTSIGQQAFYLCSGLTNLTLGTNLTIIWGDAFSYCTGLTSVVIPGSVTGIGEFAFTGCTNLKGIFFEGNALTYAGSDIFFNSPVTVYYLPKAIGWDYLPGTAGWDAYFGRPTALWLPQMQTVSEDSSGRTNPFGFNINWASEQTVVVEACTNLFNPDWQPVQTNTLTTGSAYFSDSQWTNYPGRFYRLRSP